MSTAAASPDRTGSRRWSLTRPQGTPTSQSIFMMAFQEEKKDVDAGAEALLSPFGLLVRARAVERGSSCDLALWSPARAVRGGFPLDHGANRSKYTHCTGFCWFHTAVLCAAAVAARRLRRFSVDRATIPQPAVGFAHLHPIRAHTMNARLRRAARHRRHVELEQGGECDWRRPRSPQRPHVVRRG